MQIEVVEGPEYYQNYLASMAVHWLRLDELSDGAVTPITLAARQFCESYCDRLFTRQTWKAHLDQLAEVQLPGEIGIEVQEITYLDADGERQTVDPSIYTCTRWGNLVLNPGQAWPEGKQAEIIYDVGPTDTPAQVEQAIRLLIGHFYEHRTAASADKMRDLPLGVESLLARHRKVGA